LEFHKSIITYFFETEFIRFRIIIINSNEINNLKFNRNDAELGFYKFYYQLLHHWIFDHNNYDIFLDLKTFRDRTRLKILKEVLINANLTSDIRQVQSLPSNESIGIQIADLLTGLTVSKFNEEISSLIKFGLIEYIQSRYSSINPTNSSENKFNIFRIKLQGGW